MNDQTTPDLDATTTQDAVHGDDVRDAREHADLEVARDAVSTLFGLGRMWAAHGLNIGRAALETSAITLETTAQLLGTLSEHVDAEGPAPAESAVEDRSEAA